MNGHARRCKQTVEALGFNFDADASIHGKLVYRHPAAPEQCVKIWGQMAELAARAVMDKARQIAGLAGATAPTHGSIRERARIRKQGERQRDAERAARAAREREPFQVAADERARRLALSNEIAQRDRARRDIESLMKPGGGR